MHFVLRWYILIEIAQVMLIQNFDDVKSTSLANGSRGKVVSFTNEPPLGMKVMVAREAGMQELFENGLPRGEQLYTIVEFLNGEQVAIGPRLFETELSGIGICARVMIPLKLAWAITVHKSQGMTLDLVKVDLKGRVSSYLFMIVISVHFI